MNTCRTNRSEKSEGYIIFYSILKFFSLAIRAVLIFQVLHSIRATHNHSVAFS